MSSENFETSPEFSYADVQAMISPESKVIDVDEFKPRPASLPVRNTRQKTSAKKRKVAADPNPWEGLSTLEALEKYHLVLQQGSSYLAQLSFDANSKIIELERTI